MSYIDDEELKIGIDEDEDDDLEDDIDLEDDFVDIIDDDIEEDELAEEFKGIDETDA